MMINSFQATTLHKFSGIEDGRYDPQEVAAVISNNPKHKDVLERVRQTDTLIVDECSMISSRTFCSVSEVLSLKDPSIMFGGIQVILCGDFRQLPPVKDVMFGDDGSYCFEAPLFHSAFPHHIELTEIVRQSEPILIRAISEISTGTVTENTLSFLNSRNLEVAAEDTVHLFARNYKVDDFNRKKIMDLPGTLYEFNSTDEGENKSLLQKLTVPKNLWLKVGIPVILLRNITDRLVNGLRGRVCNIDDEGPTVEFKSVGITTRLERFSFQGTCTCRCIYCLFIPSFLGKIWVCCFYPNVCHGSFNII
ncbi:MAG: AAA family ATPase [Sedimenticola sp.]